MHPIKYHNIPRESVLYKYCKFLTTGKKNSPNTHNANFIAYVKNKFYDVCEALETM